jgi:hypothetical protein
MLNFKLFMLAAFGTAIVYCLTDLFIIQMEFWQFFLIELLITLSHEVYNYGKHRELKRIKSK